MFLHTNVAKQGVETGCFAYSTCARPQQWFARFASIIDAQASCHCQVGIAALVTMVSSSLMCMRLCCCGDGGVGLAAMASLPSPMRRRLAVVNNDGDNAMGEDEDNNRDGTTDDEVDDNDGKGATDDNIDNNFDGATGDNDNNKDDNAMDNNVDDDGDSGTDDNVYNDNGNRTTDDDVDNNCNSATDDNINNDCNGATDYKVDDDGDGATGGRHHLDT